MGTLTAQVLIGTPHTFHDGISPTYAMYLSENDRPAWVLLRHDPLEPETTERIATWIPTVEDMLEDGLLMLAAHVANSVGVREALGEYKVSPSAFVALGADIGPERLERGRMAARADSFAGLKLVLTVLPESTVISQTSALERYEFNYVLCLAQA